MHPEERIQTLLRCLASGYGDVRWWDAPPEEVMLGAVLTQQTRWENVEDALARLREAGICTLEGIARSNPGVIQEAVRRTGFYRVKTRRLQGLCTWALARGGIEGLSALPTPALRAELLKVRGVGEETADSILCYAFFRPSFVIDAYTRRICGCVGVTGSYADLKALFERVLSRDARAYGQAHGWIVEYAKDLCAKKRCEECRIRTLRV